jgi:hypothetical protein
MNLIIQIVQRTPIWVFPLIVVVLWLGSINLRKRTVSPRVLWALPMMMLAMATGNSIGVAAEPLTVLLDWLFAATIGAAIGWMLTQKPLAIEPGAGRMTLPRSVVPLAVCVAMILLRYTFGYLYGRYPELRADRTYALTLIAGSAVLGGIMLGRGARLGLWYWRAKRTTPARPAA